MDFAKSNFAEGVEAFDGALWAQYLIGETVPHIVERGSMFKALVYYLYLVGFG
ncbi:hypothetical protein OAF45_00285 [Candidatus Latescibacteria bacterium]|jgi:hypothetical protein|nr:hypothetical protein [Candidatus Latescibacterota bacterium]